LNVLECSTHIEAVSRLSKRAAQWAVYGRARTNCGFIKGEINGK